MYSSLCHSYSLFLLSFFELSQYCPHGSWRHRNIWKNRAPSIAICLQRRGKDSGMIPWWGFWVQEFSNKDKQNKGLHGSTYPFLSHRGGMDGKFQPQVLFCIWGFALVDTVQYCFLKAFCKNRPGDVLVWRCTPLVFHCLASGRFVRAVWRILWRCTLELFAAVILSLSHSQAAVLRKRPCGNCW